MSEGLQYVLVVTVLLGLLAACVMLGYRDKAQFFEAHHCHNVAQGYVCKDGAIFSD